MLLIVGNSVFVKPVIDLVEVLGLTLDGIIDVSSMPDIGTESNASINRFKWPEHVPLITDMDALKDIDDLRFIVAIEDNKLRQRFVKFAVGSWPNAKFPSMIHPGAILSPSALLGEGSIVHARSSIGPDMVLGRFCIIASGVTIGPDCKIGDYTRIDQHVHFEGDVKIGEGATLNSGVYVVKGVEMRSWCEVPLRTVVERDGLRIT